MGKKNAKADVLQQKSPAEFFAENKNIAGFDNVSIVTPLRPAQTIVRSIFYITYHVRAARKVLIYDSA
jgi:DNA topoisomerase VI subunit B